MAQYYSATEWSSYYFYDSAWLIPVVMLGYFVVIVLDNLLVWHTNKTIAAQTSATRGSVVGVVADGGGEYVKTNDHGKSGETCHPLTRTERRNDEDV